MITREQAIEWGKQAKQKAADTGGNAALILLQIAYDAGREDALQMVRQEGT